MKTRALTKQKPSYKSCSKPAGIQRIFIYHKPKVIRIYQCKISLPATHISLFFWEGYWIGSLLIRISTSAYRSYNNAISTDDSLLAQLHKVEKHSLYKIILYHHVVPTSFSFLFLFDKKSNLIDIKIKKIKKVVSPKYTCPYPSCHSIFTKEIPNLTI